MLEDLLGDWQADAVARRSGRAWSGTASRATRTRPATSWPATASPTSGSTSTATRRPSGCSTRRLADDRLPAVFLPDGSVLAADAAELADRLGLRTRAELDFYDLVIVGGGPAGLAAAVYGASEGLRTVLVERAAPGGQAGRARGSRTTSASRPASPAPISPAGRTTRRDASAPSC